jgi:hypothetical protein
MHFYKCLQTFNSVFDSSYFLAHHVSKIKLEMCKSFSQENRSAVKKFSVPCFRMGFSFSHKTTMIAAAAFERVKVFLILSEKVEKKMEIKKRITSYHKSDRSSSSCQFHQCFTHTIFVRNFCAKNHKAERN